jgi:outer membrane protein OmpA-like peptidoglycan-associated protein
MSLNIRRQRYIKCLNAVQESPLVGHTDNVAGVDSNMKLSQARADSVVKALVSQYGIDAKRLTAYGVGPLAPVAPNKTEEGRAKNRRVELVEQ